MKSRLVVLIVLTVSLLAVTGWFFFHPRRARAVTVPSGARAGDIILKSCTVEIGGAPYEADCGMLVVPENRRDQGSRLIALPVKRIRSADRQPAEPIFCLGGGPGQSNLADNPPRWLLARHDVVRVGYRGVDGTPKLDCPEVAVALKGTNHDLLSAASLDNLSVEMKTCATRLRAAGVALASYSIPEVVEDMEAARRGLGYQRIDLLSESFGTRVAQIHAYMYPESLLRSAMIGVNPPGHFVWAPDTVDSQVEQYANLCRRDPECNVRTPDLGATMRSVNQSMPRRWLFLPIDPGKVKNVAFVLLFHRSTAPVVFDAYLSAERGDPSGLAVMSLAHDFVLPGMITWGQFFAIGGSADYERGRDYRAEMTTPGAILGAPMSLLIWGCVEGWPVTPMKPEYRQVHPTDVETLLISGSNDFSTPAQFAENELLPSLRKGRHIVIAEQGHVGDFWRFQPRAAERLLTSFYDTGMADASLYAYVPMDFKPAVRLPILAKISLIGGILLIAFSGWAAVGTVRRVRRRRAARKG